MQRGQEATSSSQVPGSVRVGCFDERQRDGRGGWLGREENRDQDQKTTRERRTSFNNDGDPYGKLVPPSRQHAPSSYTLTDLLPLSDSFQIGVCRLAPSHSTFTYAAISSSPSVIRRLSSSFRCLRTKCTALPARCVRRTTDVLSSSRSGGAFVDCSLGQLL